MITWAACGQFLILCWFEKNKNYNQTYHGHR
jgi:hypothetical protein